MRSIIEKSKSIIKLNYEIGYKINQPITIESLGRLEKYMIEKFSISVPNSLKEILQISNGLNYDGVFLYGLSEKVNLNLIEVNLNWHTDEDFAKFIFYADTDLYLFVQEIETKVFSFRPRDNFDEVLLETTDDELFFQIILECALEGGIEEKYCE
ncbi:MULTISPECIES: YrhA family protein [Myroides]|uniref:Knr4/Smi1-like domain-containing protein n=1 Tax=Myroides albus TaxID=2562892 RepID=A0A6I3LU05_9FLAO|nr:MULTISPECIES: YrhA family protein [Myroides]MTG99455.1 hypothetical protein [Myroides albus]MVX37179.1 hypothetical protein [Myroides sp. LoEW2-1]UVD78666.1 YrhA family protein [Myroides albus]